MNLSVVLYLIGILGFILNRKNIILMLISIEIMLLAVKRIFSWVFWTCIIRPPWGYAILPLYYLL
jgi:NADH:ubiquinone oxidoreductase subunit K